MDLSEGIDRMKTYTPALENLFNRIPLRGRVYTLLELAV